MLASAWLVLVATAAAMSAAEGHRKVLLTHVDAITLRKGGMTAGRRSAGAMDDDTLAYVSATRIHPSAMNSMLSARR